MESWMVMPICTFNTVAIAKRSMVRSLVTSLRWWVGMMVAQIKLYQDFPYLLSTV